MTSNLPVRKTKCATCPFRPGSKYACLALDLGARALTEASRICHSTGEDNGINQRTGLPEHFCRGARDVQLQFFAGIGFIKEATDEAWGAKMVEMGLPPLVVADPVLPQ